ncbi:hypothetical protein EDC18_11511 [Natranaerovirga pectinivora]|uniref:DUF6128 domain-containing protein n=1 Tax=Natranaerovirga pectinivora TaxID=682400 RepID=A0A4R3MDX6_9FIRM|nr:DUF6128 domain-containing protein [Natranaerovirga pectinivora]TCT11666.1 hypothetical protein EDC18_11511 [Natranaerovirga pectinivora]
MSNKYLRQYMDLNKYQYGVKKNRCGHGKIDARDDKCKIYVFLNDVEIGPNEVLKAYGFKYEKGNMIAIPLGTLEIENNSGKLKVSTQRVKVMSSPYAIEDLVGIVVVKKDYYEDDRVKDIYYGGCISEDTKINMDSFKEYGKVEKKESIVHNISQKNNKQEQESINVNKDHQNNNNPFERMYEEEERLQNDINENAIEIERPEELDNYIEDDLEGVPEEEEVPELPEEPLVPDEDDMYLVNNDINKSDVISKGKNFNNSEYKGLDLELLKREEKRYKEKWGYKEGKDDYNPVFENATPPQELLRKQLDEKELDILHNKMFSEYPKMAPFERYEDILDCIRIEPKDIATLPINIWMLMNNTFLLNGYNKYKHLILLKVEDDCNEKGYKYMLGVPGIYHKKDRFIAYLYGFNKFRCCCDTYPKPGEYGYWTIDVGNHM